MPVKAKAVTSSISFVALYVTSRIQRFTAERFNVVINSGEEVELREAYMYTDLRSRRHSDGESENNFFNGARRPFRRGPPASDSSGAAS